MRHPKAIPIAALALLVLSACRQDERLPAVDLEATRAGSRVVARVGNDEIGASDIAALAASENLSPEDALDRLISEAVLAQEASSRGYAISREGERAAERLMVRTMLHDLEKEATPEAVTAAEIRADYERYESKYRVPERRRAWHVLVRDAGPEAKALAEAILKEIRSAPDPRAVFARYQEGRYEPKPYDILAEELPAVIQDTTFEKPFQDALFGAKTEGPLRSVVQTSHGWHAIFVEEILPEDVLTMIKALAHQGALAIENASMYLRLQADKESLEQDIWSHRSWF